MERKVINIIVFLVHQLFDGLKKVVGVVVHILQLLKFFQEVVEHNGARVMECITQLLVKIKTNIAGAWRIDPSTFNYKNFWINAQ